MDPFPRTSEIVELTEELDSAQHLKDTNHLSCGPIVDNRNEKFSMQKFTCKYALEDDINKLFDAIDLKASARGLRSSRQLSTDSLRKSASKKPIRGGVPQAYGIGISESVTLKQALRGLSISHASQIAAMKRSALDSLKVSEAGTIKRLYRTVIVEANESGFPLNEGKGSLVEISLVLEQSKLNSSKKISLQAPREKALSSTADPSAQFAVAQTKEVSMTKAPQEEEMVPTPTEILRHTSPLRLGKQGELDSVLSLSRPNTCNGTEELNKGLSASTEIASKKAMHKFGKNIKLKSPPSLLHSSVGKKVSKSSSQSPGVVKQVLKNKCFLNKKTKKKPVSACTSSDRSNADGYDGMSSSRSGFIQGSHRCNQKVPKESSPAISSSCLDVKVSFSNVDSRAIKLHFGLDSCNKRNFDAKAVESSRPKEPPEFSQSSKSSVGEYSSSTCISEDSPFCGYSCNGSRPHMSKDLKWDAIRRIEMEHGSLGMRHFKLFKKLGSGDVGTVYLAELTGTNCLFAVKIMDTDALASKKKMSRAQTEREILQMLDHPFLPTLYAHFTINKYSILVMEYCPGGDLHILRQKQPGRTFTEAAARFYAAEVLLALEYLHMLGIVYRDLKPENILVREDGHIMLSDFDLSLRSTVKPTLVKITSSIITPAKRVSRPCLESSCSNPFCLHPSCVQVPCFTPRCTSTSIKARVLKGQVPQLLAEPTSARSNSFVGTHEYLAPEIIRGEGHGNAVDWWTFGIFLYELLFGETPFKGLGNDETLANVVMHGIKFPESPSVSSEAMDLIKGLLLKEPQNRFGSVQGATEIKQQPFFKGLNWALIRCAAPPVLPRPCDSGVLLLAKEENKLVEHKRTAEEQPEFELF